MINKRMLKHLNRKQYLMNSRCFSNKSQINLESTLSLDEFVGIIDEDDHETGEVMTRREMRKYGKWHRSTSIFVINEHH